MRVTDFQSVKSCIWGTQSPAAQMPLTGSFVPDAQSDPKNPFLLRRNAPYAPRRNVADSTILQKAQAAMAPPEVCGPAAPNLYVSPCPANPRMTISISASSSMRYDTSKICGSLHNSEFANNSHLLLLGSGPKNATLRAFLRMIRNLITYLRESDMKGEKFVRSKLSS
jgi:hypothetical protein